MTLPTIYDITRLYLYGQSSTPTNFFSNLVLNRGSINEITVPTEDIFDPVTGPGRFANASVSPVVFMFFENVVQYWENGAFNHLKNEVGEVVLTKAEAIAAFGLEDTDNGIRVDSHYFADETDDYAERVYVWGTMAFKLADDVVFKISADGVPSIENFSIVMRRENEDFDWQGGTSGGDWGSEQGLRPGIDPSDLAGSMEDRALIINYGGAAVGQFDSAYTYDDFLSDQIRYEEQYSTLNAAGLPSAMNSVVSDLFSSGVSATVYQGKAVIFGTHETGDLLDGTNTRAGYDVSDSGNNMVLVAGEVSFPLSEFAQNGIVYVTGGGADTVLGTAKDDLILDGAGFDTYDGRGGFDLVSYAESYSGVQLDLASGAGSGGTAHGDHLSNIAALLGSAYNDTLTSSGDKVEILAGGAGDDIINVEVSGHSPTIVWGGEGADRIQFASNGLHAVGILAVTVNGLTEENFHFFDLDMLGLGDSFDWSTIDAVVINSENSDSIWIDGVQQGVSTQEFTITGEIVTEENRYNPIETEEYTVQLGNYLSGSLTGEGLVAGFYKAGFLEDGSIRTVFASGAYVNVFTASDYADELTAQINRQDRPEDYWWENHFSRGSAPSVPESYSNDSLPMDTFHFRSGYEDIRGNTPYSGRVEIVEGVEYRLGYESTSDMPAFETSYSYELGPWFILGGQFVGDNLVATEEFVVTMPDPEEAGNGGSSGGSGGGGGSSGSGAPRGGSFGRAGNVSNLSGGEGVQRIIAFDAESDVVVVDGEVVNLSDLPEGATASEVNGSVLIRYSDDDYVVLRGVSLAAWEAGAADQIHGTAASETIAGTATDDIVAAGGGDDSIVAGAGNDRIIFTSGNDVIHGDGENTGADVLDLRRFASSDVSFVLDGTDVLIETPDGVIRLEAQVLHDLGHENSNIEEIIFADSSLDEETIRWRVLADQISVEDDVVQGTEFADYIYTDAGSDAVFGNGGDDWLEGAEGPDSLSGGSGNDTISGGSGDDSLTGGQGADAFVFVLGDGMDTITDFNALDGGDYEGDVMCFEWLGVGTFTYLGAGAFSGGSDNPEARVSDNQVLVDTDGDGTADITVTLTGLTNASQLTADDFLFV